MGLQWTEWSVPFLNWLQGTPAYSNKTTDSLTFANAGRRFRAARVSERFRHFLSVSIG